MYRIKEILKGTKLYKKIRGIKGLKAKLKKYYRHRFLYPHQYNKYKKNPLDEKKVVFIENRLSVISNTFQLIYEKLDKETDFDLHVHNLLIGFTTSKDHEHRVLEMLKDIATAKYIFMSEGSTIMSTFQLRKGSKIVQTWHGCGAFKKFGYSTADLIFGDSRKGMERYPSHKNYSLVTISSEEVKWAYAQAMNLPKDTDIIKATGVSRTDIFFDQTFINKSKEKLYSLMPSAKGKKVILYSPTFRGRVVKATTPDILDVESFQRNFEDEYVLLMKHHPVVKNLPVIPEQYSLFAMDMTKQMTIEELLCVSDICISDYSSLVFEYSLFERPMIFFAYDIEEFCDWRGFYYPYEEFCPGPIVSTNEQLIEVIQNIEHFDRSKVTAFKRKFMGSCDGKSTERILRIIMNDDLTL